MKNQPNDMVTLEWLLPLFNQQLSQVSDGWQLGADSTNYEQMVQHYHQVGGALTMVNLPLLADLATKLSLLAGAGRQEDFTTDDCRSGRFSHRLLQRELTQYMRTGSHHTALINRAAADLTQSLSRRGIATDLFSQPSSTTKNTPHEHLINSDFSAENVIDDIELIVPNPAADAHLDIQQYQQLLLVWRQQVQALLAANSNQPSILALLQKVSEYLWQSTKEGDVQRLWYLTELWLHDRSCPQ